MAFQLLGGLLLHLLPKTLQVPDLVLAGSPSQIFQVLDAQFPMQGRDPLRAEPGDLQQFSQLALDLLLQLLKHGDLVAGRGDVRIVDGPIEEPSRRGRFLKDCSGKDTEKPLFPSRAGGFSLSAIVNCPMFDKLGVIRHSAGN
ncbi:hypothetical protein DESUT3_19660 [Desulfuromonas versatilis]|uniref:Secreted protein n=1 Tax=Desulfuromonas versatilis TaxID=2802975 RepID=A0ABM8HSL6_9BACT|nr:hypothetical protein [Desulfuromonas versatilis]BCR04897.1 hypothetical protein DESUT3_19660 [Desulfuromonas versatilis]